MSRKRSVGFDEDRGTAGDTAATDGGSATTEDSSASKKKRITAETKAGVAVGADEGAIPPSSLRRSELRSKLGSRGPLAGIKNLGATCYINSLVQSLFMTPEFREHILAWTFDAKQRHAMNLAYQLQLLLHKMAHPKRGYVDAKDFIDSFGMGPSAYRQQHDVQELNRQLLDVVQTFIDRAGAPQALRSLYEGHFADVKRCTTCLTESAAPSPFQDLSVAIAGHSTLEAALEAFRNPDVIEGVTCDACDDKRTVEKFLGYASFPKVLTIQLRRIDFNMTTFEREKVKQDVKLPLELDVDPLLHGGRCTDGTPTVYKLQTVIAHSGTAYFGHYYAFGRVEGLTPEEKAAETPTPESGGDATAATVGGRWIKFNDDNVDYVSAESVEEYIDPAAWKQRGLAKAQKKDADRAGAKDDAVQDADGSDSKQQDEEKPSLTVDTATGMGTPSNTDDAFVGSLFGDDSAGGDSSIPAKTPAGSSYYAIYRRVDLPDVTVDSVVNTAPVVPEYVTEANNVDDDALNRDAAELAALSSVVAVGVVYRGQKHWINGTVETTVASIEANARQLFNVPDALFTRLRSYSSSLKVLGATHQSTDTLADLGCNPDSSAHLVLGMEATESADVANTVWPSQKITEWDLSVPIRVYQPTKGTFAYHRDLYRQDKEIDAFYPDFTFLSDATAATVWNAVAERIGVNPAELEICVSCRGTAMPIRYDPETGEERDLAAFLFADLPNGREAETLMVERREDKPDAPPDVVTTITNPHLLLRSTVYLELQYVVAVMVTYYGDRGPAEGADDKEKDKTAVAGDGSDDVKNADGESVADAVKLEIDIDGRKMLTVLKAQICDKLGVSPAETQLLVEGARREPATLESTVRSSSFGMKKLNVGLVNGAPLAADETYVEVFVATNKLSPLVEFAGKVLIKTDSTVADVVARGAALPKARDLGLDEDVSLCRPRLMPPNRAAALGTPMYKPLLKDCMTTHHFDNLKIVLQPLDQPPAAPLTKSTLILTLHYWDSRNPDPKTSLGARREFVTAKDAPVRDLVVDICRALDVDTSLIPALPVSDKDDKKDGGKAANDSDKTEAKQPATATATAGTPATNGDDTKDDAEKEAPPPLDIEFAKARTYLLSDHTAVATRLPWAVVDVNDPKELARHLGGFPLRLEQDDMIVIRRPSDPWPEGITQHYGEVVGGNVVVKRRQKGPKGGKGGDKGGSGGGKGNKKQRDEPALALRAMWDMPEEEKDEKDATTAAKAAGDDDAVKDATATTTTSTSDAAAVGDAVKDASDAPAPAAPTGGCGDIVSQIPTVAYDAAIHGELEEACAVCTCEFEAGETVVIVPSCHHIFHPECLAPWANDRGTCAKCLSVIILDS